MPKAVRVLKISEEEIANNTGGSEIKGDGGIRLEQGVVNIPGITSISESLVPVMDDKNLRSCKHARTRIMGSFATIIKRSASRREIRSVVFLESRGVEIEIAVDGVCCRSSMAPNKRSGRWGLDKVYSGIIDRVVLDRNKTALR